MHCGSPSRFLRETFEVSAMKRCIIVVLLRVSMMRVSSGETLEKKTA